MLKVHFVDYYRNKFIKVSWGLKKLKDLEIKRLEIKSWPLVHCIKKMVIKEVLVTVIKRQLYRDMHMNGLHFEIHCMLLQYMYICKIVHLHYTMRHSFINRDIYM